MAISEDIANAVQAYEAQEELLSKSHPSPTFPGLGLPDNRRETPIVEGKSVHVVKTPSTSKRVVVDPAFNKSRLMVTRDARVLQRQGKVPGTDAPNNEYNKALDKEARNVLDRASGAAYSKPDSTVISFSLGDKQRQYREPPEAHPLVLISKLPSAATATKALEDFHLMLKRVADKYGHSAKQRFVRNLWFALPSSLHEPLGTYTMNRAGYNPHTNPVFYEESLAHLISYLNSPGERTWWNRQENWIPRHDTSLPGWKEKTIADEKEALKDPKHPGNVFHAKMKNAYQYLQALSDIVDPSWVDEAKPWNPIDRPPRKYRFISPENKAPSNSHLLDILDRKGSK